MENSHRQVEVSSGEDKEGGVATEFETETLHCRGGLLVQQLPNLTNSETQREIFPIIQS